MIRVKGKIMKKAFEHILQKDEQIIEVVKPNKLNFFFVTYLAYFILLSFLSIMIIIPISLDDETVGIVALVFGLIVGGLILLSFTLTTILSTITYRKRYYAYTNKRIIIKSGVIGSTYKSLDHKMIGAVEVRVDLIDKLLRKNTGTIKFGSLASPMFKRVQPMFSFKSIKNPYELTNKVKSRIDELNVIRK